MLSLHFEHRLVGKIHDGLAQIFTIICTQLEIANEELSSKEGETFSRIQRALELAHFGFAEARRFARNEPSNIVDESRLAEELRRLVERSTVPGRLRCDFRSDDLPAKRLSPTVQHALVRIAQEAVHNAVRHANPSAIVVSRHWNEPNIILQLRDNESGISAARLEKSDGFGLGNLRERTSEIDGRLEIQTAVGRGTTIAVTVPISSFQSAL
jgi:signal transduction histidine kinase